MALLRKSKTPAGTPAVRNALSFRAPDRRRQSKTPAGSLRYAAFRSGFLACDKKVKGAGRDAGGTRPKTHCQSGPVVNPGPYWRFITEATQPAPKPLSILTTLTLLAQLFNMPSNAATPWKLAP